MRVLVFDTETTGLPTERNASIFDTHKWPHVVQLSYIVYDTLQQTVVHWADDLVQVGRDVLITPESIAIHGLTPERCQLEGRPLVDLLKAFHAAVLGADLLVGHNLAFDKQLLMVECNRLKLMQPFTLGGVRKPEFCTMKKLTQACQLTAVNKTTGETYPKYPTLSELHQHFFQCKPTVVHDALADVVICLRCYLAAEHPGQVLQTDLETLRKGSVAH